MRKQFGLIVLISIFSITILFLTSCNGTNSTPPPSDSSAVVVSDTMAKAVTPRYNMSGYLDYLWIDSASFVKLSPKVTLRFYIEASDTLTLRGWSKTGDQYNNAPPDVFLNNGSQSDSAQFGPGSYFGNLQLSPGDIKTIQKWLNKTNSQYVVFVPLRASTSGGQISYNIIVTTDKPNSLNFTLNSKTSTQTNTYTNPSPPKNGVQ